MHLKIKSTITTVLIATRNISVSSELG